MNRRPKYASTPIDNEHDHEISESQKKHFTNLGYKPYLSYRGKIKWLSYEQHIYEKIKYAQKKGSLNTIKSYRTKHRSSRWHKRLFKLLYNNWIIILVILVCIIMMTFYNQIFSILSAK